MSRTVVNNANSRPARLTRRARMRQEPRNGCADGMIAQAGQTPAGEALASHGKPTAIPIVSFIVS
jgi:hypothetical protein